MTIGRAQYVNAYVEDPDRLILCVWNPMRNFWSLPGCEIRPSETPGQACVRTLLNECYVGVKHLEPLYEDDAGTDGYVIAFHTDIDGMPTATREEAPLRAMTHDEYLAQTPFPKFYSRMFAIARQRNLYCIMVERFHPATGTWQIEDEYAHGFTRDEARAAFMIGERQNERAGILRVIDCARVIGFKVTDKQGVRLAV